MSGDPRNEQAEALLDHFGWEPDHIRHVRDLALMLFDQLKPLHELGDDERDLLNAAALLHDIGWTVSGSKHHKHSAWLIRENAAKLSAFPPEQLELVAQVARYHRKALPKEKHKDYAALSAGKQDIVRKLAGILRIADGLDRPHMQAVRELKSDVGGDKVVIQLKARLEPAAHIEGGARKKELFEIAFGRPVEFATL